MRRGGGLEAEGHEVDKRVEDFLHLEGSVRGGSGRPRPASYLGQDPGGECIGRLARSLVGGGILAVYGQKLRLN